MLYKTKPGKNIVHDSSALRNPKRFFIFAFLHSSRLSLGVKLSYYVDLGRPRTSTRPRIDGHSTASSIVSRTCGMNVDK